MIDRVERLQQAKQDVVEGINEAITTLRGSVEFRDAVEELLRGTPFEKPSDAKRDFEGLYGRLRNALKPVDARALQEPPRDEYFDRLATQAREISALLAEAKIGPCPLPEGVRRLIQKLEAQEAPAAQPLDLKKIEDRTTVIFRLALERIVRLDLKKDEHGRDDFYSGPDRFFQSWNIARSALDQAALPSPPAAHAATQE